MASTSGSVNKRQRTSMSTSSDVKPRLDAFQRERDSATPVASASASASSRGNNKAGGAGGMRTVGLSDSKRFMELPEDEEVIVKSEHQSGAPAATGTSSSSGQSRRDSSRIDDSGFLDMSAEKTGDAMPKGAKRRRIASPTPSSTTQPPPSRAQSTSATSATSAAFPDANRAGDSPEVLNEKLQKLYNTQEQFMAFRREALAHPEHLASNGLHLDIIRVSW